MNIQSPGAKWTPHKTARLDIQALGEGGYHFPVGKALAGFPLAPGRFGNAEGIRRRIHFQSRFLPQPFQIAGEGRVEAVAMNGIGFCFSGGHGGIQNPRQKEEARTPTRVSP